MEWIIGKNNKNNKNNKNDGAGSRDVHRIWAKLFWNFRKHWESAGSPGKVQEVPEKGREHETLPGNASARVCECYRT